MPSKKNIILGIIIFCSLFYVLIAKADDPIWPGWEVDYPWNPPQDPNLPQYVNYIYNVAFFVAGFLAVLMIIIGGIQWISSAASPQQKMAAKNKITRSIIGLVALFAIFVVLKAINPDILVLKDIEVSGVTPNYDYSMPSKFNVFGQIEKDLSAHHKGDYDSRINTLSGESETPCECAGTYRGEWDKPEDNRCGTYCFHACRRFVAREEEREISNKVYGVVGGCEWGGSGNDWVECWCYESDNVELSEAITFEFDNACEVKGDKEPKCITKTSEYCYDYCKNNGYKVGYISRREPGADLDLVWCTCFK